MTVSYANKHFDMTELVDMLGQSLGDDKAREVLASHARRKRYGDGPFDVDQALELLESITHEPGIVGTTARFAKSRIHLLALG